MNCRGSLSPIICALERLALKFDLVWNSSNAEPHSMCHCTTFLSCWADGTILNIELAANLSHDGQKRRCFSRKAVLKRSSRPISPTSPGAYIHFLSQSQVTQSNTTPISLFRTPNRSDSTDCCIVCATIARIPNRSPQTCCIARYQTSPATKFHPIRTSLP